MFRSYIISYRVMDPQTLQKKYVVLQSETDKMQEKLDDIETKTVSLLKYPDAAAARNGLHAYVSGEVERKIDSLENWISL